MFYVQLIGYTDNNCQNLQCNVCNTISFAATRLISSAINEHKKKLW